jgi:hypothetical protein
MDENKLLFVGWQNRKFARRHSQSAHDKITSRHVFTIHREFASDSDTQIPSTVFMKTSDEERTPVTLGRRRASPVHSVHLLVIKLLAYTVLGTQIRLQLQLPS